MLVAFQYDCHFDYMSHVSFVTKILCSMSKRTKGMQSHVAFMILKYL